MLRLLLLLLRPPALLLLPRRFAAPVSAGTCKTPPGRVALAPSPPPRIEGRPTGGERWSGVEHVFSGHGVIFDAGGAVILGG